MPHTRVRRLPNCLIQAMNMRRQIPMDSSAFIKVEDQERQQLKIGQDTQTIFACITLRLQATNDKGVEDGFNVYD